MSTQTKSIIIVTVIIAVGVGAFLLTSNNSETNTTSNSQSNEQSSQNTNNEQDLSQPKIITLEEVAKHNTKDDCWTIIKTSVYDITEYIPRHPGGSEIILACGTDGTSLFTSRTTSDDQVVGSGEPHSSSASRQLEDYFIGVTE
jgi:L-lactate dehydrogenase (cytochrome)